MVLGIRQRSFSDSLCVTAGAVRKHAETGLRVQKVYWRLIPGIDNKREEARLDGSDADRTKSWPTQPEPPEKSLCIRRISMWRQKEAT